MAWLGKLGEWRETAPDTIEGNGGRPWLAFRRGLITNLLNPKAAVFYVAVLPEFIPVDGGPAVLQTLLLSVVYVAIATTVHSAIVALAGTLQASVATTSRRRMIRRGLALVLVGIAIWFALTTGRSS